MLRQICTLFLLATCTTTVQSRAPYYPYAEGTEYKAVYESHESPHPFNFGYEVLDEYGNKQERQEHGDEHGNVKGSYGYTDAHGVYRHVDYVADKTGFRALVKSNEPGLSNEDPADVHITAKDPPQHVLEQGYGGGGGGKALGSYSEPKVYLKSKPSASYIPTYKESYAPSVLLPVAVKPYTDISSARRATKAKYYGRYY